MNENVINYIATFLSQIVVGIVFGICWNNSITELGVPNLSILAAIALWFGILIPYIVLTYIAASMFRNVTNVVVTSVPETKQNDTKSEEQDPSDDDEQE